MHLAALVRMYSMLQSTLLIAMLLDMAYICASSIEDMPSGSVDLSGLAVFATCWTFVAAATAAAAALFDECMQLLFRL